jgi:predicted Na+-dependent transporter
MSRLQQSVEEEGSRPTAQHATTPPQQDPQTYTATATTPTNPSKRTRPEWLDIILTTLQDQWFLVGIGVVITIDTRVLSQNYSRWKVHLFVQGQCFLMTSAIAFGVVSASATKKDFVDPGLLVGLIFFGCVATTMSSNVVMTRQAHGNSALTVVQTTLGNFLGVSLVKCYLMSPRRSQSRGFAMAILTQR